MGDSTLPAELEKRVAFYEDPANDPGGFTSNDWTLLVATGILLPLVCLVLGWFVGWSS
ncbi:MAG TPA: hypothetical protein VMW94_03375 [Actinomycetes bacterium]|jgi:hypothetical protein|nr:hypothetical protein [Actinomycetes bacterium]